MNVEVRDATPADAPAVADLFYLTILNVNTRDYSRGQVEAWAGPGPDSEMWSERIASDDNVRRMFIASWSGRVVGFAELEVDGHIDTLYVHHEFQGRGTASQLLDRIEAGAQRLGITRLVTEASITAEPFFRRKGFSVVESQQVEVRGHTFTNYRMEKKGL